MNAHYIINNLLIVRSMTQEDPVSTLVLYFVFSWNKRDQKHYLDKRDSVGMMHIC